MPESSKWTLVAWAVAAGLAVLAFVRVVSPGDPEVPPVALGDAGGGPPAARAGRGSQRGAELYVHVAGYVRRPGLYRVPPGSRVAAALEAAGGPTRGAGLTTVNLAAPVEDGQQVVVPRAGAAPPGAPASARVGSPRSPDTPAAKLSLGAATVEQLDSLDGIGPTLAKRIVAFRDSHGGIRSVGQLREVEGIGEKRFAALSRALGP